MRLEFPARPVSRLRHGLRLLLGGTLVFTGAAHLTFAREEFQGQVPPWLPLSADAVIVGSGVVELGLGVALIAMPRHRGLLGWATAALFVAVFPGNVWQYVSGSDAFGLDTDTKRLVRLPFQPLLILWALWSTGARLPRRH